uniref:Uncharacterized protein n=1 Tax=Palpitomonas bilix TaxID=652834 RepID=A0A7S3LXC5_9EUKA
MACIFFVFFFWMAHGLLTRVATPPRLRFGAYLKIISKAPFIGFAFSVVPFLLGAGFILAFIKELKVMDGLPGYYTDTVEDGNLTPGAAYRAGRIGLAFMTLACYLIWVGTGALVPKPKKVPKDDDDGEDHDDHSGWKPELWRRSHLVVASLLTTLVASVIIEISFSAYFEEYVYVCLVYLTAFGLVFEEAMAFFLSEQLHTLPLALAMGVAETTVTMGASDFTDFMFSFFIELLILIGQRVYLDPLVLFLKSQVKPMYRRIKKLIKRLRRRNEDEDGVGEEDDEEEEEHEEHSPVEEIMESFAGYAVDAVGLIFTPFIIAFVWIFDAEIQMSTGYSIRVTDFMFYLLFAVIITFAQTVMDIFLHNILELFHGWKIFEYLKYATHRYERRTERWKILETHENESIEHNLRSLDKLCFSSQFYFMINLLASGIICLYFSIQMMIRQNYSMFSDQFAVPLLFVVIGFCMLMHFVLMKIGKRVLWKTTDTPLDDGEAIFGMLPELIGHGGDFAIPKWEDIYDDTKEGKHYIGNLTARMKSETFRHKFLDVNRPWLIQQLANVMTPRSRLANMLGDGDLQQPAFPWEAGRGDPLAPSAPDGALFQAGNVILPRIADGGEISDDSETSADEAPGFKQLSKGTRLIARMWLADVRERMGIVVARAPPLELSDDDDSGSEGEGSPPERSSISPRTEEIARIWLQAVRSGGFAPAPRIVRDDISSDDSSDSDGAGVVEELANEKTVAIAKIWLAAVRGGPPANPARAAMLSSDESSDDSGSAASNISFTENTREIARIWLAVVRQGGGRVAASLSSDSMSSDSDRRDSPPDFTENTRAIAGVWLRAMRSGLFTSGTAVAPSMQQPGGGGDGMSGFISSDSDSSSD